MEEKGLAGFIYTQLTDVEEETNGLLTYDRRVIKLARAAPFLRAMAACRSRRLWAKASGLRSQIGACV